MRNQPLPVRGTQEEIDQLRTAAKRQAKVSLRYLFDQAEINRLIAYRRAVGWGMYSDTLQNLPLEWA